MHFLSNFVSHLRFFTASHPIRDQIQTFFQNLPHLSVLAGVFSFAWRAVLVAEPAGTMVFEPFPILPLPGPSSSLVVMSANLKHDFPRFRDRIDRLEAFAALVESEEADVLLLQEVARTDNFNTDEWLRNRLGMAYVYARANGHRDGIGFEEGVAVFSRFPLANPEVRELGGGTNPFARRIALNAEVRLPGGDVEVFTVHLGIAPSGNRRQIEALQGWAEEAARLRPVVVGGDFNAEPGSDRIQALQDAWIDAFITAGDGSPTTHTLSTPWGSVVREHRLDYIFLVRPNPSAWNVDRTAHLKTDKILHSDHAVVVAEFDPGFSPSGH